MALKLYNTLTRQIDELKPHQDNQIRMYTCGPTVYHFVHIGNFRTFIFQDILRRYIIYKGFDLLHVMNITDVEDKIISAARREGVPIQDYTKKYEDAFLQDMEALRIQRPEEMPRATEHIQEMIDLISALKEQGFTYQSDGSTYFRINQFSDYGKLSQLELEETQGEGHIDEDEYSKENPRDFVLWKARKDDEEFWDSPFGEGRPGWHIECSAMSMKYLGKTFDVHCGGVDLIFPHHENEIAQSEAANSAPFVRHWVHGAHLIVEGQKMSKSLGNFFTLRDLLDKGCHPLPLRYLLFSVHYRKQLNFTFEGLEQAQSSIQRADDFLLKVREIPENRENYPRLEELLKTARQDFESAMDHDLNTSAALAAIFEFIREGNLLLEENKIGSGDRERILAFFHSINGIFDVFQVAAQELQDQEIVQLIEERREARRHKEYERADAIRDQLAEQGILLEDTKEGTRWKRQK